MTRALLHVAANTMKTQSTGEQARIGSQTEDKVGPLCPKHTLVPALSCVTARLRCDVLVSMYRICARGACTSDSCRGGRADVVENTAWRKNNDCRRMLRLNFSRPPIPQPWTYYPSCRLMHLFIPFGDAPKQCGTLIGGVVAIATASPAVTTGAAALQPLRMPFSH